MDGLLFHLHRLYPIQVVSLDFSGGATKIKRNNTGFRSKKIIFTRLVLCQFEKILQL